MQCPSCQKLGLKIIASSCPHGRNLYQRAELDSIEIYGHRTRSSIRWVSSGEYQYQLGHKKFVLQPNRFLVLNDASEYNSLVSIKSKKVKSHTLSFASDFLASISADLQRDTITKLDNPKNYGIEAPVLFENTFQFEGQLGAQLQQLENLGQQEIQNDEFFYPFAESLIRTQLKVKQQLAGISTAKKSTKEELFRRLLLAYELIMQDSTASFSTQELASFAAVSEFHFLRSFKAAFGISPRQLQNQNKMKDAQRLLDSGHYSASEIAYKTGFNDLSSFSHAFKKWRSKPK
jgi:AraC family transcriptional regulator